MTFVNPVHIAFIALVALVFLGPRRLPELARGLGSGMREFRESLSSGAHDDAVETLTPDGEADQPSIGPLAPPPPPPGPGAP